MRVLCALRLELLTVQNLKPGCPASFNKREYVVAVIMRIIKSITVDDAINVMNVRTLLPVCAFLQQGTCWLPVCAFLQQGTCWLLVMPAAELPTPSDAATFAKS